MSTNVGSIDLSLVLDSSKFKSELNNVNSTASSASSKISSTLKKIGSAVAIAFSVTKIVEFGKECLEVSTEVSNAWIGLNSIVTGTGKSFSEAQSFIEEYVSDGLVPLSNAVSAYKNLALRGYNTEQIEQTMEALKNSATYSRQSSYTLGDAVETATEGLKNENSVLVDNAGVTKNVAKMWEDYADSIGKTTDSLTDEEKIQAEVNGILEETEFQSNDAATYAQTYAGKVAQLSTVLTNMKTAIGNVIQPIAKLFVPVITKAVNAVNSLFTSFANLLALFGLEADSADTVSSSLDDLTDTADDTSDSVDEVSDSATDASESAEEASNNLASWDDLNVLEQDDDSSSSSSDSDDTSSSGSSIETTSTSSAIEAITEASSLLSNIDFTSLIESFNRVKEAAEPLVTTIKDGLKWLYDNVLVPLAKWTIEDLLPSFLNLVAGALKVINPLLTAFKPIGQWLWDNFLKPIAQWTGGVIVSVLNGLASVLTKIGDWMSNNQSTVTKMEAAVLGFFAAWKVTKLLAFIAQSGGLISVFKNLTAAIFGTIAAKIVDEAETIYLTALYAKDFFTGIASGTVALAAQAKQWIINTALKVKDKVETIALELLYAKDFVKSLASGTTALVKQAAQWVTTTALKVADKAATVASTVATTAATAATWLFNAALAVLTSPITLVIAAITALVAGIYFLLEALQGEDAQIKTTEEALEDYNEAVENTKEATNSYVDAVDSADEALENLKEAEETAGMTGEELNALVEQGTLDYANMTDEQKELYKAYLNNNEAQDTLAESTTALSEAKKAETTASLENQLAIAAESGNYDDFKKAVTDAYEEGSISAEEARDYIERAMGGMSTASKETFTEDIPSDLKEGLNPTEYDSAGTKIKNWFKDLWKSIKTTAGEKFDEIKGKIVEKFNKIKDKLQSKFEDIGEVIGEALSGTIKSAINWIFEKVENFVNKFFRSINSGIDYINNIPGVNISKLSEISLPRLAQGGFVKANTPQLAVVGDNKTQGEIISPEDKLLEQNLKALDTYFSGSSNNNATNNSIDITFNFDGTLSQLVRLLKIELDKEEERRGAKLIIGGTT